MIEFSFDATIADDIPVSVLACYYEPERSTGFGGDADIVLVEYKSSGGEWYKINNMTAEDVDRLRERACEIGEERCNEW